MPWDEVCVAMDFDEPESQQAGDIIRHAMAQLGREDLIGRGAFGDPQALAVSHGIEVERTPGWSIVFSGTSAGFELFLRAFGRGRRILRSLLRRTS